MTINELIGQVDRLKPNKFEFEDKLRWLSDLEGMIVREIISTHEDSPLTQPFEGYTRDTDMATELLAPYPYDSMYRWYLESQIDLANAEVNKYNNSSKLFNSAYLAYTDYYNRTHMPRSIGGLRFTERRMCGNGGERDALST